MTTLLDWLAWIIVSCVGAVVYALAWAFGDNEYRDWLKDDPDAD
jgi:hypothetical protein